MSVDVLLNQSGKPAGLACDLRQLAEAAKQPDGIQLPDVMSRQIVLTGELEAANDTR